MAANLALHSPTSILSVIVLYNCELAQSLSFTSLLQILNADPELAKHLSLVLYDNSPQPQNHPTSASFPVCYIHDPSNGGLAAAYNFALARAEEEEREWLLLLDQDTTLTAEFLSELVEAAGTLHTRTDVAAIVPKLRVNGRIDSPSTDFFRLLRRQFSAPEEAMREDTVGVQKQPLCSYNSASTIRVKALRSIGGFPMEFWLDFMDHAVFHALSASGYCVYVMLATLIHDSSYSDHRRLPLWRLLNILRARTLHVQKSGNLTDRFLYRIWLLRHSRNLRESYNDPRAWRETALQALRLKAPKDKRLLT
jgi:GT2 family glycosyltransferase